MSINSFIKKTSFTALLSLACAIGAKATPVSQNKAKLIAKHYISIVEPTINDELTLCHTWNDNQGNAILYVFNIGQTGFIIVSADDDVTPIAGYSLNGMYNQELLPSNLRRWIQDYVTDTRDFLDSQTTLSDKAVINQLQWKAEWNALIEKDNQYYARKSSKSVDALVTTRWSQGAGYNNYCPEYQSGDNGHCVTGCVATAMAQIIRYHQYPNVGFWHNQYIHSYFGIQRADFDSVYYDYSLMPTSVNRYSSTAQQNAVSLLCYHCGVAVNMNYENPNHTSGSGAHSEDVTDGLKYFGYTNSFFLNKNGIDSDVWDSLLRHDIDLGRPIYYSGSSSEGGHAFVCDGYNNSNKYHFNFGWGGYGDGFYSLTYVNGYSSAQAAVFNIVPSNLGANLDTIYFDPTSDGDGSSWANANQNLEAAMVLRGMYKSGTLMVKGGTYYGDTNSDNAFTLTQGLKIYGSYDSTGTARNLYTTPTILSGRGQRRAVYTPSTLTKSTNIYNITFADGYADDGSALLTNSGVIVEGCAFENSQCYNDDGAAVLLQYGGNINCCIVRNNDCNGINLNNGHVKNNLIVHNSGYGVRISSDDLTNCTIVSNTGTGIVNQGGTIRGCVIWNNDCSLANEGVSTITFCAIEGYETLDSNSNFGINALNDPETGDGPIFLDPDTTRGPHNIMGDWHLSSRSPLVDAADTTRSGNFIRDLDGNSRFQNGRSDIGCYESNPTVSIVTQQVAKVHLYPNPATSQVTIVGAKGDIDIFDIMGRHIANIKANTVDNQTTIDISHLISGLYIIRNQSFTYRFIKK